MAQEQKKGTGFSSLPASPAKTQTSGDTIASVPNVEELLSKHDGKVKVIHGANDETFDGLVGQSVAAVRASLVDSFNIPGDALALVDGEQVDNNTVLQAGQTLEFIKAAGVKGQNYSQM